MQVPQIAKRMASLEQEQLLLLCVPFKRFKILSSLQRSSLHRRQVRPDRRSGTRCSDNYYTVMEKKPSSKDNCVCPIIANSHKKTKYLTRLNLLVLCVERVKSTITQWLCCFGLRKAVHAWHMHVEHTLSRCSLKPTLIGSTGSSLQSESAQTPSASHGAPQPPFSQAASAVDIHQYERFEGTYMDIIIVIHYNYTGH